jgi:hypothetical protein
MVVSAENQICGDDASQQIQNQTKVCHDGRNVVPHEHSTGDISLTPHVTQEATRRGELELQASTTLFPTVTHHTNDDGAKLNSNQQDNNNLQVGMVVLPDSLDTDPILTQYS